MCTISVNEVQRTAFIQDLGWTDLQTRRKNFRLTSLYKILNGLIAVGHLSGYTDFLLIVSLHHYSVRRFVPSSYIEKTFRPHPIHSKDVSPPCSYFRKTFHTPSIYFRKTFRTQTIFFRKTFRTQLYFRKTFRTQVIIQKDVLHRF